MLDTCCPIGISALRDGAMSIGYYGSIINIGQRLVGLPSVSTRLGGISYHGAGGTVSQLGSTVKKTMNVHITAQVNSLAILTLNLTRM